MRKILNGIEHAATRLQKLGEKAADEISERLEELRPVRDKASADAASTPHEESPTPFDDIDSSVESQLNHIRSAQQTPGAFSDYIAEKFGKKEP